MLGIYDWQKCCVVFSFCLNMFSMSYKCSIFLLLSFFSIITELKIHQSKNNNCQFLSWPPKFYCNVENCQVGTVTTICCTCFLIRCIVVSIWFFMAHCFFRDSLLGVQESCLNSFLVGRKEELWCRPVWTVSYECEATIRINLMFTAPDVAVHCCDKPTRFMVYRSSSRTVHRVHVYILVSCWFIYF